MKKLLSFLLVISLVGSLISCKKEKKVIVTFDPNNGEETFTNEITKGKKVSKPTDPIYQGHSFVEWHLDGVKYEFNKPVEADIKLVAFWNADSQVKQVTIIFNSDGGSDVPSKTINENERVDKPADPLKLGYKFVGWYIDGAVFNFDTIITKNLELKAEYVPEGTTIVEHVVTINVDDVKTTQKVVDGKLLFDLGSRNKTGFKFIEWQLNGVKFDFNTPITANIELKAVFEVAESFEVKFEVDGNIIKTDNIYEGDKVNRPSNPNKEGYRFVEWRLNGSTYNFNNPVTGNIILVAYFDVHTPQTGDLDAGGYFESLYATFNDSNPKNSTVQYKETSSSSWITVDKELVRKVESTTRVDVVGLKEGFYDLKVTTSNGTSLNASNIEVMAHDRSGYAHFKYNEGVGAYKDDGTLKDDAIVIYVTEQNKNSVTIPGVGQTGIGWILNNNQFVREGSSTYSSSEYSQSIAKLNKPLAIRILGKVTPPEGVTVAKSTQNGGSLDDNGMMARMREGMHITIEGIGEDAQIDGWGIHFIAGSATRGKSWEVRNLMFAGYPEDALGAEGHQLSSTLDRPVERVWIHHNSFRSGTAAAGAGGGDKSHGDGAIDLKRGQYFTVSYNKLAETHKTGLVGSNTSDITYHVTFHHNLWQNVKSRSPLTRGANVHLYNNVVEITDDFSGGLDYIQEFQAGAYAFGESNYIIGSVDTTIGGTYKSYNEIRYSISGSNSITVATSRTQQVSSSNTYANFDTNKDVFYYDPVNQVTDVTRLTDPITARAEVMEYCGTYHKYGTPDIDKYRLTNKTPITILENTSGSAEGENEALYVFNLLIKSDITLSGSGFVLASIYGEEVSKVAGTFTLNPGIYMIEPQGAHGAAKASKANVTYNITLDSVEVRKYLKEERNKALAKLPSTVEYTEQHLNLINSARSLYDSLDSTLKQEISETKIIEAENTYKTKGKILIEEYISSIGVVNENSYSKIKKARNAYDNAIASVKASITNLAVLTQSEQDFKQYEVINLNNTIISLVNVDNLNVTDVVSIEDAHSNYQDALMQYNSLNSTQKTQINNINKVNDGLAKINELLILVDVINFIDEYDISTITMDSYQLVDIYESYNELSSSIKSKLPSNVSSKLNNAWSTYSSIRANIKEINFSKDGLSNSNFTGVGTLVDTPATFNGQTFTKGLEFKNSSPKITFTTTKTMTLRIYIALSATNIKIDGNNTNVSGNIIEIQLTSGNHSISRGSNGSFIVYQITLY